MILHVLPGDAIVEVFKDASIDGDVAVCREALIDGDVSGDTLPEFSENRARVVEWRNRVEKIVLQFKVRGGEYGYGDVQVKKLWQALVL